MLLSPFIYGSKCTIIVEQLSVTNIKLLWDQPFSASGSCSRKNPVEPISVIGCVLVWTSRTVLFAHFKILIYNNCGYDGMVFGDALFSVDLSKYLNIPCHSSQCCVAPK